jgi:hypothetical protein
MTPCDEVKNAYLFEYFYSSLIQFTSIAPNPRRFLIAASDQEGIRFFEPARVWKH